MQRSMFLLSENHTPPTFLPFVCQFIRDNCCTVGLFRVSGDESKVIALKESMTKTNPISFDDVTVHDVCSALKRWLMELSEPLIIPELLNLTYIEGNTKASVSKLLEVLPDGNRKSLACIVSMLRTIVSCSGRNMMTLDNLNVCFFPALFQQRKGLTVPLNTIEYYNALVEKLNSEGTDFDRNKPPNMARTLVSNSRRRGQMSRRFDAVSLSVT